MLLSLKRVSSKPTIVHWLHPDRLLLLKLAGPLVRVHVSWIGDQLTVFLCQQSGRIRRLMMA